MSFAELRLEFWGQWSELRVSKNAANLNHCRTKVSYTLLTLCSYKHYTCSRLMSLKRDRSKKNPDIYDDDCSPYMFSGFSLALNNVPWSTNLRTFINLIRFPRLLCSSVILHLEINNKPATIASSAPFYSKYQQPLHIPHLLHKDSTSTANYLYIFLNKSFTYNQIFHLIATSNVFHSALCDFISRFTKLSECITNL